MPAFMKSLARFLSAGKSEPAAHLAAFGKHPGWNDHTDDLGLDTDALVTAKRLLYVQGISQNIDSGAWERLESDAPGGGGAAGGGRLDRFRHDFFWHMPANPAVLLAGRLWSSVDGKGRDKYPMVLAAQFDELPASVARATLPFLAQVHERCAAATTADEVRAIVASERDTLRARIKDPVAPAPLTVGELLAVARHPDLQAAPHAPAAGGGGGGSPAANGHGFHRIVYSFVSVLSAYRIGAPRTGGSGRRPEQLRLPACGLSPQDALFFWYRFAFAFIDMATPLLLLAPDGLLPTGENPTPWVDMIAGEPAPQNLFCIKAGLKHVPLTSDIPYTLEPAFLRAVDNYLATAATLPETSPIPAIPINPSPY
jgi:hypothetical protein